MKHIVHQPNRERFLAICRGQRPGDVAIMDWFHRTQAETPDAWIEQGAPRDIKNPHFLNQYFGFEHLHGLIEIVSEHNRSDLKHQASAQGFEGFHITPPIVPVFECHFSRN